MAVNKISHADLVGLLVDKAVHLSDDASKEKALLGHVSEIMKCFYYIARHKEWSKTIGLSEDALDFFSKNLLVLVDSKSSLVKDLEEYFKEVACHYRDIKAFLEKVDAIESDHFPELVEFRKAGKTASQALAALLKPPRQPALTVFWQFIIDFFIRIFSPGKTAKERLQALHRTAARKLAEKHQSAYEASQSLKQAESKPDEELKLDEGVKQSQEPNQGEDVKQDKDPVVLYEMVKQADGSFKQQRLNITQRCEAYEEIRYFPEQLDEARNAEQRVYDQPYKITSKAKTAGAKSGGKYTGLYKFERENKKPLRAMIKSTVEKYTELMASELFKVLLPKQAARCRLVTFQNGFDSNPEDIYVMSEYDYNAGFATDIFHLAGVKERQRGAGSLPGGRWMMRRVLAFNDKFDLGLEDVVWATLYSGDKDIHLGNVVFAIEPDPSIVNDPNYLAGLAKLEELKEQLEGLGKSTISEEISNSFLETLEALKNEFGDKIKFTAKKIDHGMSFHRNKHSLAVETLLSHQVLAPDDLRSILRREPTEHGREFGKEFYLSTRSINALGKLLSRGLPEINKAIDDAFEQIEAQLNAVADPQQKQQEYAELAKFFGCDQYSSHEEFAEFIKGVNEQRYAQLQEAYVELYQRRVELLGQLIDNYRDCVQNNDLSDASTSLENILKECEDIDKVESDLPILSPELSEKLPSIKEKFKALRIYAKSESIQREIKQSDMAFQEALKDKNLYSAKRELENYENCINSDPFLDDDSKIKLKNFLKLQFDEVASDPSVLANILQRCYSLTQNTSSSVDLGEVGDVIKQIKLLQAKDPAVGKLLDYMTREWGTFSQSVSARPEATVDLAVIGYLNQSSKMVLRKLHLQSSLESQPSQASPLRNNPYPSFWGRCGEPEKAISEPGPAPLRCR